MKTAKNYRGNTRTELTPIWWSHYLLNEKDQAFAWLNEAVAIRDSNTRQWVKSTKVVQIMGDEPRYQDAIMALKKLRNLNIIKLPMIK